MSEWKDISTAPTDGRKIILWFKTCREPSTGWYDYDQDYANRRSSWPSPEHGWRQDGDQCIPVNQHDCTHWMPLPEPPVSA